MEDELIIDILLWAIYVMLAVALGAAAFSLYRSYMANRKSFRLHASHGAFLLLPIVLLVCWFVGGSLEAMFVDSILIMLLLAIVAICSSAAHTKFLR